MANSVILPRKAMMQDAQLSFRVLVAKDCFQICHNGIYQYTWCVMNLSSIGDGLLLEDQNTRFNLAVRKMEVTKLIFDGTVESVIEICQLNGTKLWIRPVAPNNPEPIFMEIFGALQMDSSDKSTELKLQRSLVPKLSRHAGRNALYEFLRAENRKSFADLATSIVFNHIFCESGTFRRTPNGVVTATEIGIDGEIIIRQFHDICWGFVHACPGPEDKPVIPNTCNTGPGFPVHRLVMMIDQLHLEYRCLVDDFISSSSSSSLDVCRENNLPNEMAMRLKYMLSLSKRNDQDEISESKYVSFQRQKPIHWFRSPLQETSWNYSHSPKKKKKKLVRQNSSSSFHYRSEDDEDDDDDTARTGFFSPPLNNQINWSSKKRLSMVSSVGHVDDNRIQTRKSLRPVLSNNNDDDDANINPPARLTSTKSLCVTPSIRLKFHQEQFRASLSQLLSNLLLLYLGYDWTNANGIISSNDISEFNRRREVLNKRASGSAVFVQPNTPGGDVMTSESNGKRLWRRLKKLYFRKRATELLHAQRDFKNLGELLKIAQQNALLGQFAAQGIGHSSTTTTTNDGDTREMLLGVRNPVMLFLGGGMGAGKTSLLTEIMSSGFWKRYGEKSVVIEADKIKLSDPIFQALTIIEQGDVSVSSFVHSFSTSSADKMLLNAVQSGRDVIMDGTLTWLEYVTQTIDMIRNSHRYTYRMGPGYSAHEEEVDDDSGNKTKRTVIDCERYWEISGERLMDNSSKKFMPYRIQIVGVTCSPHVSVARGLRRSLLTKRGVPIEGQLRSHKLFSKNFPSLAQLVDEISLYDSTSFGRPILIAQRKSDKSSLLVDPVRYPVFAAGQLLNEKASYRDQLWAVDDDNDDDDDLYNTNIFSYYFHDNNDNTVS